MGRDGNIGVAVKKSGDGVDERAADAIETLERDFGRFDVDALAHPNVGAAGLECVDVAESSTHARLQHDSQVRMLDAEPPVHAQGQIGTVAILHVDADEAVPARGFLHQALQVAEAEISADASTPAAWIRSSSSR